MGGAAPDTIIGPADADRAGARPYRATSAKARRDVQRGSACLRAPESAHQQWGGSAQMGIRRLCGARPYPEPVTGESEAYLN